MMSASIFWSFIAARTAPQRRSSSSVEIGWLTRSLAAMNAPLALHHVDHPLHVPRQPLSHVLLDHGKSEARVAVEKPALVLGDDDVLQVPERRISGQRLGGENVERGAGDFPAFQRIHQSILVYHAAARQVDKIRARLHRGED